MRIRLVVWGLVVLGWIFACSLPQEPKLPQWDLSLDRIPLFGADTLVVGQEFSDPNLVADANQLYHIKINGTSHIDLQSVMRQDPVRPMPVTGQVGSFKVSEIPLEKYSLNIFTLFPELRPYAGQSIPIAAQDFTLAPILIDFKDFASLTLSQGTLYVHLKNNMPFALGKPIRVQLVDRGYGQILGTAVFEPLLLGNGGQLVRTINLANKIISNQIDMLISGHQDGSGSQSYLIDSSSDMQITLQINDLVITSATAKIPQQSFNWDENFDLSTDSITVFRAKIKSGNINMKIQNDLPFAAICKIEIPGLFSASQTSFVQEINMMPRASQNSIIELSDKTIELTDGNLNVSLTATIQPNPNSNQTISATDKVTTSVQVSEIIFSELAGKVNGRAVIPPMEQNFVQNEFDISHIRIDDGVLSFHLPNWPADMMALLVIQSFKNNVEKAKASYQIPLKGDITNRVRINKTGVLVNDTFGGTGSGILEILNSFPEKIRISGTAQIKDDLVELRHNTIPMAYSVDVPLIFAIDDNAVLNSEITELEFEKDERDAISRIKDAKLQVRLQNGIPLGGTLTIQVADENTFRAKAANDWPTVTQMVFLSAPVNAAGETTGLNDQIFQVQLSEQEIRLLSEAHHLFWSVRLNPTAKAQIKSTDKFIVEKCTISGTMRIDNKLVSKD